MRKANWLLIPAAVAAVVAAVSLFSQGRSGPVQRSMPAGDAFRILLGVGDKEATPWDGSVTVSPGAIASISGWRFTLGDSTDSVSSWKCSTRTGVAQGANGNPPMLANGVIVTASTRDSNAQFNVKTAQGSFSFSGAEIAWGEDKAFLDGRVVVDRVPTMARLTDSTDEQDFPAIAQSDDNVYLSYVEFVHANRELEGNRQLTEAPANFDYLARPAGGDQVFLMTYSKSKRTWSAPVPVSAAKQDVARTSVAVDGQKRVWVFWSAQKDGNFDIYANTLANGRWSGEKRITSDSGTDLNPVAATDSSGRVWVAWQGFRNNNLEVLAAAQNGDNFSPESIVSFSKNSDWDPAIATASNGEVAVAWDTYDKGDYDVYFRRLRLDGSIKMDSPVPVAVSPGFEARASVAFDKQNRLWVAYEASDTKWGKDYGAYETTGVALYQDHTAKVKCFEGNQAKFAAGDLAATIPGPMGQARRRANGKKAQAQAATAGGTLPNPQIAKNRAPSGGSQPPPLPKNSFPRIVTDPAGTLYLTFRTPMGGRGALGTAWEQNVAYLDGGNWKGTITVPSTDYWLDVRAAMTAIAPGDLMMVSVTDHRFAAGGGGAGGGAGKKKKKKNLAEKQQAKAQQAKKKAAAGNQDNLASLNADLFAAEFHFGSPAPSQTGAAATEKPSSPSGEVTAEREQIKTMRDYRVQLGSDKVQIMRGEFHRHTEISGDGGNDGPLVDAYRYLIDAADMDWAACCDHDNGGGREYSWWLIQKMTDAYHLGNRYVPMFGYERSVVYPEGHRNIVNPRRGVRPLSRLPLTDPEAHNMHAPDTQMLYRYLKQFGAIVASHTSGTNMGTDWRDNDPQVEPVVEIYQGDRQNYEMPGAPRANNANDSIGGWQPLGFVSLALKKGYRLGFQASSDHISTHMSYCNLWVTSPTREGIMEAFHKRRVYGSTDNILADVRCDGHFMGEEFSTARPPAISVKLWGTANFAKVNIIKDGGYAYSIQPGKKNVDFSWQDTAASKGKTSYYYVRGEQADGELVWVSPMWITYQ